MVKSKFIKQDWPNKRVLILPMFFIFLTALFIVVGVLFLAIAVVFLVMFVRFDIRTEKVEQFLLEHLIKLYARIKIKVAKQLLAQILMVLLGKVENRQVADSQLVWPEIIFSDNKRLGKKQKAVLAEYVSEYILLCEQKRKKLVSFSTGLASSASFSALVLLLAIYLFNPFYTVASTFGFVQDDWSGGASTTAYATHSSNRSGWNKYSSKDSGISAGTSISLIQTTTTVTQTAQSDFGRGSSTATAISGYGSDSYLSLAGTEYFDNWNSRVKSKSLVTSGALRTVVEGNYAYTVGYGTKGLYISDISNKSNPILVATYTTSTAATFWDVKVSGDYAYLSTNNSLIVLDVSNKANPIAVGRNASTGDVRNISLLGNYLYLMTASAGMKTIDVTNKANPTIIASLTLSGPTAVHASTDGYVYISYGAGNGSLGILDVSSTTNPVLVASTTAQGVELKNINVVGNTAYVAAAGGGLKIYDVTAKSGRPTLLSTSLNYTFFTAYDVVVSGNYAYVADGISGLIAVDVSSTTNPIVMNNYNTGTAQGATGVFLSGNYAYVADNNDGLYIFDITTPFPGLELLTSYTSSTFGTIARIKVSGTYTYLIDNRYLYIVDTSNESLPVLVKKYDLGITSLQDIDVVGDYVYLAAGTAGFKIVNVSNKVSPTTTATLITETSYGAYGVKVVGDYAYIANHGSFRIADISNKASPVQLSVLNAPLSLVGNAGSVDDVDVSGNYAYLGLTGNNPGVQKVDISDKTNPGFVGKTIANAGSSRVSIGGNYLYAPSTENGTGVGTVSVYDIAGTYLSLVGRYSNHGNVVNIESSGNYLYGVGTTYSYGVPGMYAFDISDPINIQKANTYMPMELKDISVVGNYAYTIGPSNTIKIFAIKTVASTGSFTSEVIDSGAKLSFTSSTWSAYTPSSSAVTVKARTSNDSNMSGATAWSSCSALVAGGNLTGNSCITDTDRYLQFNFDLTTNNNHYSSKIKDFSFGYISYPSSQSLISSAFNSENASNLVADLSWTETLPAGTDVKFQIRTAPNNGGQPGTWTEWLGPTGTTTYYSTANGRNSINANHRDGTDDQWVQYKVILESNGQATPVVDHIQMTYVSNVPPEFEGALTAVQSTTTGYVTLSYKAKDINTADSEAGCPNCVVPSFEYSLDGGVNWNTISAGLPAESIVTSSIAATYGATTTVIWNAKALLDGIYSNTFKVKVILDDREGTNNLGTSESATFTVDFKDPVISNYGVTVIATSSPALLLLNAVDDSADLLMCITLNNTETNCLPYNATSSITLATNPDVVYVKFVDKYHNITSANATTPETPANIMIRDNSDMVNAVYQEFLAWKAVGLPFNKYQIWYSTDNITFSLAGEVDNRAVNYYFHQSLTLGQTYYYKITTADERGNVSYYSSLVSDMVDGTGGTDTIPPVISNVEIISTTTQSAVVEWDTNQFSNSQIHLSTEPGNFSMTIGSVTMADSPNGLGRHHVVINNLQASTTYYFSVESVNTLGISATDNNGGDGYTFNTKSGPVISGVTASQITNNGATIIWNTDIAGDSYVVYSSSSSFITSQEVGSGDNTTFHSVNLTSLAKGVTYYYYVRSGVATSDNGGEYFTFATAVDDVSPVITNVTTTVATDNKALINWTTNELATSLVEYGIVDGVYDQNVSDANLSTNHSILLSNLSTSTTYYYRVLSTDGSGNIASSTGYDFITLEKLSSETDVRLREGLAFDAGYASSTANATSTTSSTTCPVCQIYGGGGGGSSIDRSVPQITEIKVLELSQDAAKISWTTNKRTNSFVEYGLSNLYGSWQGTQTPTTTHVVAINNLTAATTYNYRINSTDEYGNLGLSENQIIKTDGLGDITIDTNISSDNKDNVLTATVNKAMEIINSLAGQVSVGALESALGSQYNLIRQLSDLVPAPMLGGEPRVTVTADTATVTWSSDKDSNSLVAIASADNYDSTKGDDGYSQVVGNPDELVKNHIVKISDLLPATKYNYQVRSMSAVGSMSKSPNFTFITGNRELEISSYTVERISDQEATFRWLTSGETDAALRYTPFRNGVLAVEEQKTQKITSFSTIHEISVDQFESGVAYEINLSGKDAKGTIITKKIPAFSTGEDNFPPSIYQVQTESAIFPGKDSNIQTIIYWLTNEPATGQVYYRKGISESDTAEWQNTPLESSYARKHVVVITKFEPGSIYQFKIESTDSAGNLTTSKTYTILAPKQKESVFQVIIKNFEEIFGWTKQLGI